MGILVLGGTQYIGRHIVEALVDGGHDVSVFTRGRTPDALPPAVERLHGDRDDGTRGLAALTHRSWQACVDVSGYTARQVRASAETLAPRVDQYLFVSAVSVYEDFRDVPVLESHPLLPEAAEDVTEITGETYGPLKVTSCVTVHGWNLAPHVRIPVLMLNGCEGIGFGSRPLADRARARGRRVDDERAVLVLRRERQGSRTH